jgi:hypothetical protein
MSHSLPVVVGALLLFLSTGTRARQNSHQPRRAHPGQSRRAPIKQPLCSLFFSGYGTQPKYSYRYIVGKVSAAASGIAGCFALTGTDRTGYVVYPMVLSTDGVILEIGPSRLARPRNPELDRCMEQVLRSIDWGPTGLTTLGHLGVSFFQPTVQGYRGAPPFCLKPEG